MIFIIGNAPESQHKLYKFGKWEDFVTWAIQLTEFELDIETNVTPYWCNKKIITIQFGYSNIQWVLQWSELAQYQIDFIKEFLQDTSRLKLIQNAQFEYIVLRFHGIEIDNVYDTMVVEKILTGGIENTNYGMGDLTMKYLGYDVDKTEQTTFGDNILTENKVLYAATDVKVLSPIRDKQMEQIKRWELQKVLELEMTVVLCLGEMTYYGVLLDTEKWRENANNAQPFVDAAKARLDNWLLTDPKLNQRAKQLKYLSDTDTVLWNLNAPAQKLELLQLIFPDLEGATKKILQSYIRNHFELDTDKILLLQGVIEKDYKRFSEHLLTNYRPYLIEHGYLIPPGEIQINWASPSQCLSLLTAVEPKLQAVNATTIANAVHPVFDDMEEYKKKCKMLSQYGLSFLEHVEPDGRIRTSYNQIVSTGRLSSVKPNMQNIPVKGVGNQYIECFYADTGHSFVASDYVSAEIIIIAFLSNDPVWHDAIINDYDIHSVCAELVFGKEWFDSQQEDCNYYKVINGKQLKQKCSCKKHKPLRDKVKTVSFGMVYGMGEMKLSRTLRISLEEATTLMNKYFKAFPEIKRALTSLANFGIKNGYCRTPYPFFRKRWFPTWELSKNNIDIHLSGIEYDKTLGSIGRQAGNQPIQGCSADIMKQALVMAYRWIRENGYREKVQLRLQIHDAGVTACTDDLVEMWKEQFDKLMCDAAKVVIPSGILKADTGVSKVWTK